MWDMFVFVLQCKKHHSVYEIEAPSLEHGDDEPYVVSPSLLMARNILSYT